MDFVNAVGSLWVTSGLSWLFDRWENAAMILIACVLLYFAIVRRFKPLLMSCVSLGILAANLPLPRYLSRMGVFVRGIQSLGFLNLLGAAALTVYVCLCFTPPARRKHPLFPVAAAVLTVLLLPDAAIATAVIMLAVMFRDSGVLSGSSRNIFVKTAEVIGGITVGASAAGHRMADGVNIGFLSVSTLAVIILGALIFTVSNIITVFLSHNGTG